MEKMNKVQLREAISSFGEIPAESWNVSELRHRLRELVEEQEEEWARTPGQQKETPLQQQIKQLNKNKKRKADLVEYLEQVLGIAVSPNETMSQMETKALNFLYRTVQSTSKDIVGFGRHAHLTYGDLLRDYPSYVEWVKQTHAETDETNVRLKRLANWLMRATDVSNPITGETRARAQEQKRMVLKVKSGYVTEPEPEAPRTSGAISSSQVPYPAMAQTAALQAMVETMQQMQAEIRELKEQNSPGDERPRKKEK